METQRPLLAFPLEGKTAIVTGGSKNIGAGIAYDLSKRGADVIIIHSSPQSGLIANQIVDRIVSLPHKPRAFSICGDLRNADDPALVIKSLRNWFEKDGREMKIDILVNNAGCELVKTLGSITPEDFTRVYDLNVLGTLLMTQAVLPHLAPRGRIINIGSVGSRAGFRGLGLYCSSKAALEGLTRCWAAELGSNGITVNCVNPGPVQSDMLDNIPKQIVDAQKASTPLEHRVGMVGEIAGVVCWLAGEDSRWVTGQTISASGGWAMY